MMLNGNGALDTSTYRLVNRVRDEIASHRLDPLRAQASEAPTEELRPQAPAPAPAPAKADPTHRYPRV